MSTRKRTGDQLSGPLSKKVKSINPYFAKLSKGIKNPALKKVKAFLKLQTSLDSMVPYILASDLYRHLQNEDIPSESIDNICQTVLENQALLQSSQARAIYEGDELISNLLGVNKNVEAKEALKKIKDLHLISSERLKYKLRRLPSPIVKTIIGNLDIFRFVPVCEQAIAVDMPTTIEEKKRIFYVLDPVCPLKYEMKFSVRRRVVTPHVLPLEVLPEEVRPYFQYNEWNKGRYNLVMSTALFDIYVYSFTTTQSASTLKVDAPDLFSPNFFQGDGNISDVLPLASVPFSKYSRPDGFFADYHLPLIRGLFNSGQDAFDSYVDKFLSDSIKGDERVLNADFINWLRCNLSKEYLVYEDCASKEKEFFSRFERPKKDFSFFKSVSSSAIAASMTVPNFGDSENATESDVNTEEGGTEAESNTEDSNTEAASADCRLHFEARNRNQLLANMIKTMSEVCINRLKQGEMIKKVTIYGVIVDYESKALSSVPLVMVMFVDFIHQLTKLREIKNCGLPVEDLLSRIKVKIEETG